MNTNNKYTLTFILLLLALLFCFFINIANGSVLITIDDTLRAVLGYRLEKASYDYIIWEYRIPKALTAILAGAGLAVSGLIMQTLFRNPLAGPFILGISSGASLGAALLIMGTSLLSGFVSISLFNNMVLAGASSLGSFLVLLLVLAVAIRVKDSMTLLIIGLMFGSLTAAIVSILSYFTNAEKLQQYIFWSFGSLGNLTWNQVLILFSAIMLGIGISIVKIKALNALLLGENYAKSSGINLKSARFGIIISTGILAGSITAFVGPIAFIGLAVPHVTRQLFKTMDHKILIPATVLCGAILMLICDTLAQLPGSITVLPINAITSIIGAPMVIWILVRKRKMVF